MEELIEEESAIMNSPTVNENKDKVVVEVHKLTCGNLRKRLCFQFRQSFTVIDFFM
jgi:hypothetical protein